MDEINSTDMLVKPRPVLDDALNRALKVTSPFKASDDSKSKFGDGFAMSVDNMNSRSVFADRSFTGSENLADDNFLSVDSSNLSLRGSLSSGLPIRCGLIVLPAIIYILDDEPPVQARDCSVSRVSVATCYDPCEERVALSDTQSNFVSQVSRGTRKHGPVKFQKSVLEGCTLLKGDYNTNSDVNFDSIKTCTCPFCLKASYILADLHYRNVAGRITVLKKSQNEVSNLVKRNPILKESKRHDGDGKSDKLSKLENDLIGQWKNLFLHMQDSLESDKLQEKYTVLKELRENCKRGLERMNGQPSQRH